MDLRKSNDTKYLRLTDGFIHGTMERETIVYVCMV